MKFLASEWVPRGGEDPARYKLRGLTGLEFMEMQSGLDAAVAVKHLARGKVPMTAAMMRSMLVALEDWDGVTGEDGAPLPFSPDAARRVTLPDLQWLVGLILERTVMTEDQAKN